MADEYLKRSDIITSGINSIAGLSCIKPDGAFYVFVNIKKTGMSSNQFCEFILEDANVAMLPGTSFGQFGEGFVRLCYAVDQIQINDAIKRMKKSLTKLDLE